MEIKLKTKCWGFGDQVREAEGLGETRRCGGLGALSLLARHAFVQFLI